MVEVLPHLLWIMCLFASCDTFVVVKSRVRRQIGVIRTESRTDGQGDDVLTNATAHVLKNPNGTVNMDISSSGAAVGGGLSSIQNDVTGDVGGAGLIAHGAVESTGQLASSASDIAASAHGNEKSVFAIQKGEASGVGDTLVRANGGAVMDNFGLISPFSTGQAGASAGATGSLKSLAKVLSKQLTWENILVHVMGSAAAKGLGNAQANIDIGAGGASNGVEVNGLVSGVNTQGGLVDAEVNGNATMNGPQHHLTGNMQGNVHGTTGNSTLVGATNLQSGTINGHTNVSSFGDSKVHTDGASSINLGSETSLNNEMIIVPPRGGGPMPAAVQRWSDTRRGASKPATPSSTKNQITLTSVQDSIEGQFDKNRN